MNGVQDLCRTLVSDNLARQQMQIATGNIPKRRQCTAQARLQGLKSKAPADAPAPKSQPARKRARVESKAVADGDDDEEDGEEEEEAADEEEEEEDGASEQAADAAVVRAGFAQLSHALPRVPDGETAMWASMRSETSLRRRARRRWPSAPARTRSGPSSTRSRPCTSARPMRCARLGSSTRTGRPAAARCVATWA